MAQQYHRTISLKLSLLILRVFQILHIQRKQQKYHLFYPLFKSLLSIDITILITAFSLVHITSLYTYYAIVGGIPVLSAVPHQTGIVKFVQETPASRPHTKNNICYHSELQQNIDISCRSPTLPYTIFRRIIILSLVIWSQYNIA